MSHPTANDVKGPRSIHGGLPVSADREQQIRLRRFWGNTVFAIGVLWGVANLVYFPIAALTSIAGSSWFEVGMIIAGGVLTLCGSAGAFRGRRSASRVLLVGGIVLLSMGIVRQALWRDTQGIVNLGLLLLAGWVPVALGFFGAVTERKGWPALR